MSHDILLEKADHYVIRGISNDYVKSYLSDRFPFLSICDCKTIKFDSVLGPLLF